MKQIIATLGLITVPVGRALSLVVICLSLATLAGALAEPAYPQTGAGYQLFQQALVKERAEGQVEEAITLYDRVVKEHGRDRALAAKALLQIGKCYEKLGQDGAADAYERLIRNYADQTEIAAQARSRLTAMRQKIESASTPAPHKILDLPPDSDGHLHTDGRYVAYSRREAQGGGHIEIRDLRTGRKWEIRDAAPEVSLFQPAVLNTGKLAYTRYDLPKGEQEIMISSLDGSGARRLYRREGEMCFIPKLWMPYPSDEGQIEVVCLSESGGRYAFISPDDGQELISGHGTIDTAVIERAPGGQYVVRRGNQDVFLESTDGKTQIPLVQHPALDIPGFFEGNRYWFISERSGVLEWWYQPVENLRPKGEPERAGVNMAKNTEPAGRRGRELFVVVRHPTSGLFFGQLNKEGKLDVPLESAAKFYNGVATSGNWLNDGRQFVAIEQTPEAFSNQQRRIIMRDAASGDRKQLDLPPDFEATGIYPAPDGQELAFLNRSPSEHDRFGKLNVQTGEILESHPAAPGHQIGQVKWCADGAIYRSETNTEASGGGYSRHWHQVIRRDAATGEERAIIDDPTHRWFGCVDRERLVAGFEGDPDAHTGPLQFALIDIATGARTPLVTADYLAVSPDGTTIIYSTLLSATGSELWSRPVSDGTPQKLAEVTGRVREFEFHPDGRQFVVETEAPPRSELWSYTLPEPRVPSADASPNR